MGCPVPKVCKTGAGAALIDDPAVAVAVARAAREGSGLPVTVKLRSGVRPGDTSGVALAHRLVDEAGVSAIGFHPRSAAVHHKGRPDYDLAAELVRELPVPVVLSGGLRSAARVREAFAHTGAAAVMLARGALGNPWLFAEVLGQRATAPATEDVLAEADWVMDRAVEHLGAVRAGRYLRKFYPWYVDRLAACEDAAGLDPQAVKGLQRSLQATSAVDDARTVLDGLRSVPAAA
jgi:tRNA-dihydrouridine synthase